MGPARPSSDRGGPFRLGRALRDNDCSSQVLQTIASNVRAPAEDHAEAARLTIESVPCDRAVLTESVTQTVIFPGRSDGHSVSDLDSVFHRHSSPEPWTTRCSSSVPDSAQDFPSLVMFVFDRPASFHRPMQTMHFRCGNLWAVCSVDVNSHRSRLSVWKM